MKLQAHPTIFKIGIAVTCVFWGQVAFGHASEQGFVLLLPTDIYRTAGVLTVVASIILVALLPRVVLNRLFKVRQVSKPRGVESVSSFTSLLSTSVFLALVAIGLYGPNDPQSNLLPLVIWTVWWVGLFVVQGLFFDIWRWVEPWSGLHRLLAGGRDGLWRFPSRLNSWPAVIVFLAFQGFIVADIAPNDPDRLAMIAFGYWAFTLLGMILFGRGAWLRQVECFSVLFSLIGKLRSLYLGGAGFPGWASLNGTVHNTSLAIFCLAILASGSFDGIHETFWWLAKIGINPLEFPGRSAVIWNSSLGLVAANIALIVIFAVSIWIGVWLVNKCAEDKVLFGATFNVFSVAILPIAFGYHFAHYLISFLVQIQYAAVAVGDPLANGSNFFGLGQMRVTTGFLKTQDTVRVIWLTQAMSVVVSHVLSVLMVHYIASSICANRRDILLLQVGISALMIAYTMFGLWLLASPRGV